MVPERSSTEKAGMWRRRRQYIVNPGFQWKYTLATMASVFVVSALMTTTLFGVLYDQARARTLHLAASHPWENTVTIAVAAGAFAAVMAVAFGVWTVLVTHRICGPLHVMSGFLDELAAGRFPTRRPLRKHDEFKEFYDRFWRAVDALKAKQNSDLEALARVLAVAQSGVKGEHGDQEQALASVAARLEELCRQVSESRTAKEAETAIRSR